MLKKYPNSVITGVDVSASAIEVCNKRFGKVANFVCGDHKSVPVADIIIASHVMEHITEDNRVVDELLTKCRDLIIIVPFNEEPLYFEHVHRYDEDYYNSFPVIKTQPFLVSYSTVLPLRTIIGNIIKLNFRFMMRFKKEVIMYHLQGSLQQDKQFL